jgi:hypothetical protein
MYKRMLGLVAAAALVAACSSDSSGPSKGPDLTGAWDLVSVDIGATGTPVPAPPAFGSFTFFTNVKDSVDIDLNIPAPPAPAPGFSTSCTGAYTQTATKLNIISGCPGIGQAVGTYVLEAGGGPTGRDLLTVDMVASGQHTIVEVERQ